MAKYLIDESTLTGLANAIRKVNGETRTYTPTEMIEAVTNIMNSVTYMLCDDEGNAVPAVFVESETILDATANDIRIGMTAVTEEGVTEGEKAIPIYNTYAGVRVVTAGKSIVIPNMDVNIDYYDYTKLQTIICSYNTSLSNSVSAEKVSIADDVYNVRSADSISTITKNHDTKEINFGITNDTDKPLIVRYFTYKEIK